MPDTRGLVQGVKLFSGAWGYYWVYIGPSPTNTLLFDLSLLEEEVNGLTSTYRNRMAEELSGALFARREVIVTHDENRYEIRGVEVVPG
jgi:hypothetical protein